MNKIDTAVAKLAARCHEESSTLTASPQALKKTLRSDGSKSKSSAAKAVCRSLLRRGDLQARQKKKKKKGLQASSDSLPHFYFMRSELRSGRSSKTCVRWLSATAGIASWSYAIRRPHWSTRSRLCSSDCSLLIRALRAYTQCQRFGFVAEVISTGQQKAPDHVKLASIEDCNPLKSPLWKNEQWRRRRAVPVEDGSIREDLVSSGQASCL